MQLLQRIFSIYYDIGVTNVYSKKLKNNNNNVRLDGRNDGENSECKC